MKPYLSDRPRVSTPSHPAPAASAFAFAAGGHASVARHTHTSQNTNIECVREGDRITRLVITCGCGERIEIDCLYAAGQ